MQIVKVVQQVHYTFLKYRLLVLRLHKKKTVPGKKFIISGKIQILDNFEDSKLKLNLKPTFSMLFIASGSKFWSSYIMEFKSSNIFLFFFGIMNYMFRSLS